MIGKLLTLAAASTLAISFAAAPALAQNAKTGVATSELTWTEGHSWAKVNNMVTDIRVSQQTNLSIDVALQCALATDTTVKTNGGNKGSVNADAGVKVRVEIQALDGDANPVGPVIYALPSNDIGADPHSGVTYCQRSQTLEAILQGQIDLASCVDTEGNINLSNCTLTDEEIRLVLSTLSAHAFNFYTGDLTSGDYRVTVWANPTANAGPTADDQSTSSTASASALVGLGSMVIDEVRFGTM